MKMIRAIIKPNSKKGPIVEIREDGSFVLYVREPAIEGKANQAAIELLATHFSVPKSTIALRTGVSSRYKTFTLS